MLPLSEIARQAAAYVYGRPLPDGEPVEAFVTACTEQAAALVGTHIGNAPVPDAVNVRAIVEVASELYHRRGAPSGIMNGELGSEVRLARDPLTPVMPMLSRWVIPL